MEMQSIAPHRITVRTMERITTTVVESPPDTQASLVELRASLLTWREDIEKRLSKVESRLKVMGDDLEKFAFNISPEAFEKLDPEQQIFLAKVLYDSKKSEIEAIFRSEPSIQEIAVCDGEIILKSTEIGGISEKEMEKIVRREGKVCYIFTRPALVEEIPWASLNQDYYPTLSFLLGSQHWTDDVVCLKGREVTVDFDTGCPFNFLDEKLGVNIVSPPTIHELRYSWHLGEPYQYYVRRVKICIRDPEGKFKCMVQIAFLVRMWNKSPFRIVNPMRVGLVGRRIMLEFGFELTLNPRRKASVVKFIE